MKKQSYISMVLPYLMKFKWRIIFSLLLIIGGRVLSVANPYIIKKLVDTLADTPIELIEIDYLVILVILFFFIRWGGDLLGGVKDYIFAKVTVDVRKMISLDVFEHLISLPVQFHTDQATGGVTRKISRGTTALNDLSFFLTGRIFPTIVEICLVIAVFIRLFPISFTLVFAGFVVIYVAYTIIITNRRQKLLLKANKQDDEGSEKSIDALINYETVKYFTNEKFEYNRFGAALDKWGGTAILSIKKGANLNMGQGLILTTGLTALLALAIREFLQGGATLGDFVLITSYLNRIASPLSFLGFMYRRLKESFANVDEMFKLLEVENDVKDKEDAKLLRNPEGHIVFDHISFGYKKDRIVLDDVSIDIPAKSSVAFVGASGSGKSTLSKLLLRLYDVNKGSVSVDGADIRDITQSSLREHIGVVAQDTILFNDTILNNIQYGKPNAKRDEVVHAAKLSGIHEFIEALPQGYDTEVGERGVKLSGGEKQRVAIARMLLKNPPILLFDEATASLDSKAEKVIQDSIKTISKEGKTTLVIAHRLSTIVDFDKIVVLEKGKVIEEGTHNELLKTCGAYRKLWTIQQGGAKKKA